MKEIPDVDLGILVKEAEKSLRAALQENVVKQIRHLLGEAYASQHKVERLTVEKKKAEEVRDKALVKVAKLREGDWSVLPEPKPEKEPSAKSEGTEQFPRPPRWDASGKSIPTS